MISEENLDLSRDDMVEVVRVANNVCVIAKAVALLANTQPAAF
jgi:hypothetical protein